MSKQFLDLTGLATFKGLMTDYVDDSIEALDASGIGIASVSEGVVTLKAGLAEADGIISNTSDADIDLAKVATTGAAEDISIDDSEGYFTSTDVEGALAELAQASSGGVASKTVYLTETAGGSGAAYSKRYGIYQGSTGSSASPVAGELLGNIDIPKDMVVSEGSVVNITYDDGKLYDGSTDVTEIIKGAGGTATSADAGKYIKLIIANATVDTLYIKATDLVDIYTAQQNATQIQLAIDSSNVISATIVAGSVGTTELADSAVTTAKIADDAVTAAKVSISAHTEAQTAGADGLAISVTTTDGQVSAVSGSIAANTYEAYGSIATEIAKLDAEKSQTAGTDGLALSITEVDGKITAISGSIAANTYDAYGDAAAAQTAAESAAATYTDTEIGKLDAVADGTKTAIDGSTARTKANSDSVFALQGITEADGKLSAMTVIEVAEIGSGTGRTGTGTQDDPYVYADNIKGTKTYVDDSTGSIPDASIEALFD